MIHVPFDRVADIDSKVSPMFALAKGTSLSHYKFCPLYRQLIFTTLKNCDVISKLDVGKVGAKTTYDEIINTEKS